LARAVARDAPLRLRLCDTSGITCDWSDGGFWPLSCAEWSMRGDGDPLRAKRTLFKGHAELRLVRQRSSLRHAHHAVVLSIPAAAGRQTRVATNAQREQRLNERQPECDQQQNGEKSSQYDYSNMNELIRVSVARNMYGQMCRIACALRLRKAFAGFIHKSESRCDRQRFGDAG
jgi:hypothetical protein